MGLTIFDLDHTLTSCNVSFEFGRYLSKKGYFSSLKCVLLVLAYALQKVHLLSVHALHAICFYVLFSKQDVKVIGDYADEFIASELDRMLRRHVLDEFQMAQKRGDEIWILSSSPDFLVQRIGQKLKADSTYATHYLVDGANTFSALQEVVDGKTKWRYVEQFIQEQHLPRSQVRAYSDSILDLELLEKVGHAVAVHPDKKLKKIAKRNSWKIIS